MADTSTAAAPVATQTATWAIDANTLRSELQQETNLTRGDEAYVASIAFRTTPGVTGSTLVWFHGGLSDIVNIHEGETHAIPDRMGRVPFPGVVRRGLADVLAGHNPELVGTLTLVFESDLSPNQAIDNLMADIASEARPIVAEAVEPLTLADLTTGSGIAGRLGQIASRLEAAVTPTVAEKIRLFVVSVGDPDDPINHKLNLFVAVDGSLAPLVDQQLGATVPAAVGEAGALRPRSYTQRFVGRGAKYVLAFSVAELD